jgi:hypothetical protein
MRCVVLIDQIRRLQGDIKTMGCAWQSQDPSTRRDFSDCCRADRSDLQFRAICGWLGRLPAGG